MIKYKQFESKTTKISDLKSQIQLKYLNKQNQQNLIYFKNYAYLLMGFWGFGDDYLLALETDYGADVGNGLNGQLRRQAWSSCPLFFYTTDRVFVSQGVLVLLEHGKASDEPLEETKGLP